MLTLPEIVDRDDVPYAFMAFIVTPEGLPRAVGRGLADLERRLETAGSPPAGPGFINYRRIDMAGTLDIEIGVPVMMIDASDERIRHGILPGGHYARVRWTGDYDGLRTVNAVLIGWAAQTGVEWDSTLGPDGERFACRLETYETGPMDIADPARWTTEVAIRVR